MSHSSVVGRSLYEPELDGLRLVAFLSVFLHHLPPLTKSPVQAQYGWVGVELFFVLSSYLFFRLLDSEFAKTNSIRVKNFFVRRILRIYPLMICFTLAMILYFSAFTSQALTRLVYIATFTDNVATWFYGYNSAIPNTAHLWTLAFEFQVYVFIPGAFIAWKRFGTDRFLIGVALLYLAMLSARLLVTYMGAPHPVVWVTPFLQPEAVLMGIVLATGVLDRVPAWTWPVIFVAAGWRFINTPVPWTGVGPSAFSYPLAAIACLALVQSARRLRVLQAIFSFRPIAFLGTISYGLYVFHLFGIHQAGAWLTSRMRPLDVQGSVTDYLLFGAAGFLLTILMAVVSYYVLEMPFLRMKRRFETVHGREISPEINPRMALGSEAGLTPATSSEDP
jgi:peptidoglycan/LPS O-acetylase OafA/YrhL